jgi:hypothetical protein
MSCMKKPCLCGKSHYHGLSRTLLASRRPQQAFRRPLRSFGSSGPFRAVAYLGCPLGRMLTVSDMNLARDLIGRTRTGHPPAWPPNLTYLVGGCARVLAAADA